MNTYEYVYREIGDSIQRLRDRKRLTQEALAAGVGLSRTSIVHIEKGRQKPPLDKLYLIAELLDVDVFELLPPMRKQDSPSSEVDPYTRERFGGDEEKIGRVLNAIPRKKGGRP